MERAPMSLPPKMRGKKLSAKKYQYSKDSLDNAISLGANPEQDFEDEALSLRVKESLRNGTYEELLIKLTENERKQWVDYQMDKLDDMLNKG